ncbi:hypothetical protein PanWU01x14_363640 [Parasponia andersonii]|uniref:Uncharacterized protein n=1 Tax=Parasponia andersonii TaxID=3476 RepID=A0A2P5A6H8_PARAD|nr:hypothetical protein PanWU01x14_363640 [Parasponia andersonii]
MRLAGDVAGTKKAVIDIVQLDFELNAHKTINVQKFLFSEIPEIISSKLIFKCFESRFDFCILVRFCEEFGSKFVSMLYNQNFFSSCMIGWSYSIVLGYIYIYIYIYIFFFFFE